MYAEQMCAAIIDNHNDKDYIRKLGGERVAIPDDSMDIVKRPGWFARDGHYWRVSAEKPADQTAVKVHIMRIDGDNLTFSKRTITCPEIECPLVIIDVHYIKMIAREHDHIGVLHIHDYVNSVAIAHYALHFTGGDIVKCDRLETTRVSHNISHYIHVWDPIMHKLHILCYCSNDIVDILGTFSMSTHNHYHHAFGRNGVFELWSSWGIDRVCANTCKLISTQAPATCVPTLVGENFSIQVEHADPAHDSDITITDLRTGDKYVVDRYERADTGLVLIA